jgi:uncharacterized protein YbjT (DUF2867 family)
VPTTSPLTVAVTGPTGTFGFGLMPLLQADPRIDRVVGVARRPFDHGEHCWTKMTYRQGHVRDPDGLREAFRDADVVVHLAFQVTGARRVGRGAEPAVDHGCEHGEARAGMVPAVHLARCLARGSRAERLRPTSAHRGSVRRASIMHDATT